MGNNCRCQPCSFSAPSACFRFIWQRTEGNVSMPKVNFEIGSCLHILRSANDSDPSALVSTEKIAKMKTNRKRLLLLSRSSLPHSHSVVLSHSTEVQFISPNRVKSSLSLRRLYLGMMSNEHHHARNTSAYADIRICSVHGFQQWDFLNFTPIIKSFPRVKFPEIKFYPQLSETW